MTIETTQDYLIYCEGQSYVGYIAIVVIIFFLLVVIIFVYRKLRMSKSQQRYERRMLMSKLDEMENATRETARNGKRYVLAVFLPWPSMAGVHVVGTPVVFS